MAIAERGQVLLNELGYNFQEEKIPILENFLWAQQIL